MMPKRYRRDSRGTEIGQYLAVAVRLAWWPAILLFGPLADVIVRFFDTWRRWTLLALSVLVLAATVWDLAAHWGDWGTVDWVAITGFPIGLYVLYQSSDLHRRFNGLTRGLARQEILEIYEPTQSPGPSLRRERPPGLRDRAIFEQVFEAARDSIIRHASVLSVLVGAVFAALVLQASDLSVGHTTGERWLDACFDGLKVAIVFIVGVRLGRIAAYGIVMWTYPLLRVELFTGRYRLRLNPQPGHPDKVCGLKPIGDFWTFEALALLPPLAYTLTWIGIMNSGADWTESMGLQNTHTPFVVATSILILLQVFTLWVPMLSLHRVMGAAKHDLQVRADEFAQEAATMKHTLLHGTDKDARDAAQKRHAVLLKAFADIEQVPRWPVAAGTIKAHITQLWPVLGFIGVENDRVVTAFAEFFKSL